jgi:hypothetical protein
MWAPLTNSLLPGTREIPSGTIMSVGIGMMWSKAANDCWPTLSALLTTSSRCPSETFSKIDAKPG